PRVAACRLSRLSAARFGKAFQCSLEVALGIDQEVGGGYDCFAFSDAALDLNVAAAASAELDLARLETALSLIDQDGLSGHVVDHGAFWHGEHWVRRASFDFRIDVHLGP